MNSNYLIHHGVPGMRWGVRKNKKKAVGSREYTKTERELRRKRDDALTPIRYGGYNWKNSSGPKYKKLHNEFLKADKEYNNYINTYKAKSQGREAVERALLLGALAVPVAVIGKKYGLM